MALHGRRATSTRKTVRARCTASEWHHARTGGALRIWRRLTRLLQLAVLAQDLCLAFRDLLGVVAVPHPRRLRRFLFGRRVDDIVQSAVPDARRAAAARGIRTEQGIREEHLFLESDLAAGWEALGRARMLVVLEEREFLAGIFGHVEPKVCCREVGRWVLVDVELHTHVPTLADRADVDEVFWVLALTARALALAHDAAGTIEQGSRLDEQTARIVEEGSRTKATLEGPFGAASRDQNQIQKQNWGKTVLSQKFRTSPKPPNLRS